MKFFLFTLALFISVGIQDLSAQTTQSKTMTKKTVTTKSSSKVSSSSTKVAQSSTQISAKAQGVHMTFENEHLKLGRVKKGEIKKFDFVFTNTGTETITIDIASGCDCTTLDYPKTPIKVGQKGTIHVTFDSGKKEEQEIIDVDIYLKNLNPKTGQRILKVVDYTYDFIK